MTLDDYVIGKTPSFCACVEVKKPEHGQICKVRQLSNLVFIMENQNQNPTVRYRFTQKFGDDDRY